MSTSVQTSEYAEPAQNNQSELGTQTLDRLTLLPIKDLSPDSGKIDEGSQDSLPEQFNAGSEGVRSKRSRPRAIKLEGKRSLATNNREKWRQHNVNRAFVSLRRLVPSYPPDKRLSKSEILRMAIKYIRLLESILEYQDLLSDQ